MVSITLQEEHKDDSEWPQTQRICQIMSTGAILLADIIPALVIKMLSPFIPSLIQ